VKIVMGAAVFGIAAVALVASDALAEKCSGYVVSKASSPILMREAPDGSKVQWHSGEGIFVVASPDNHPANGVNRVCGGGLKIAPDGKSGWGMGSCSYTDMDGDVFHLSWQSTFVEGTWNIEGGTGKFEKFTGHGTFRPAKRYQNFWGTSTWEGECSLAE